jgi:hypothetical protein
MAVACSATPAISSSAQPTPTPIQQARELVESYVVREAIEGGTTIGDLADDPDRWFELSRVPEWDVVIRDSNGMVTAQVGVWNELGLVTAAKCEVAGPIAPGQTLVLAPNVQQTQALVAIRPIPAGTSAESLVADPVDWLAARLVPTCGPIDFVTSVAQLQTFGDRATREAIDPDTEPLLRNAVFVDLADLPEGVSPQPTPTPVIEPDDG